MKKSEIQLSYHNSTAGLPMVNVKVQNLWSTNWDELAEKVARENYGDAPGFDGAYVERICENDCDDGGWFALACQSNWEMLENDAHEIFGKHVKVWSEGRSGGWAVVEGLPDIEEWDAIMVSKWAKFAKYARALADDVPYQMCSLILINRWESDMEVLAQIDRALAISPYILEAA